MSHMPQVFGIGLCRTGTSSLNHALRMLGLSSKHFPVELVKSPPDLTNLIGKSATDTPVAWRFEALANEYPNAKFVLTWRDSTSWLDSCRRLWNDQKSEWARFEDDGINKMHLAFYGTQNFNPEELLKSRTKHHCKVFDFFQGENLNRLLVMNILEGDGWEKLCKFLGCQPPTRQFPRVDHKWEHDDSPIGQI